MAERKKNVKLWQRLKAAHNKKISDYAKSQGISNKKALAEIEMLEALHRAEADALWQEWADVGTYDPIITEEE